MSGAAYAQSARIAAEVGPFAGFEQNREPMLRVMRKHREAIRRIDAAHAPLDMLQAARESWDEVIELGEATGIRWDFAFFQMLLETAYLKYGGDDKPKQNNFAGIGTTGGGNIPARDIPRLMQLYQQGRLDLERLVTQRLPLERVNEAFTALESGQGARTVIQP